MAKWRRRVSRLSGLVRMGIRRFGHRLVASRRKYAIVSIISIAIPVVLLLLVAGVSFGVADVSPHGESVDYWIEPTGTESAVTPVEGPKLGDVHAATERLTDRDDIAYATPLLLEYVTVENEEPLHILTIGVIPHPEYHDVAPVSAAALTDTENPSIVLSEPAATAASVSSGEALEVRGSESPVTVVAVEPARVPGFTQVPIGVMPLADLQALTGNDEFDSADQIAVVAPEGGERTERYFDELYPQTSVTTESRMGTPQVMEEGLPRALALAAVLTGIIAGAMLVVTSFAFEALAGSRDRTILAAVGLSARSRTALMSVDLGIVTVCGAILGIVLWIGGSFVLNLLTRWQYGVDIVSVELRVAILGLGAAVGIAILAFPALLLVDRVRFRISPR